MNLSEEQQIAFQKYVQGENVFITGPGGTGKSVLVKAIYEHALDRGKNIQVTAMTGCAAILLECKAKTIHSWAGIGLGVGPSEAIIEKVKKNYMKKKKWLTTQILIVDEVSMLSLKLFDLLNALGKLVRSRSGAFGSIQLIFCGDFYQLPPVGNRDEPETMQFCFESRDWFSVFPKENHIQLKKIFRQQDVSYAKALNQIREGRISRKTIELLGGRVGLSKMDTMTPTQMMPTRSKVDAINVHNMALLTGEEHVYEMKTVLDIPIRVPIMRKITKDEIEMELKYIQGGLLCERSLTLKVGSQVMCIVNMKHNEFGEDLSLCNGSQGIVTGFSSMGSPIVKFTNGLETVISPHVWASENIPTIGLSQIPLILAWAITIHKAQGTTMDCAEIDAGNDIFECGQTYVALSRVKSIEGLYLRSFDIEKITVNRKVKEFYSLLA